MPRVNRQAYKACTKYWSDSRWEPWYQPFTFPVSVLLELELLCLGKYLKPYFVCLFCLKLIQNISHPISVFPYSLCPSISSADECRWADSLQHFIWNKLTCKLWWKLPFCQCWDWIANNIIVIEYFLLAAATCRVQVWFIINLFLQPCNPKS